MILLIAVVAAPAAGGIIYVDQNATGSPHDGSNWCNAFLDLQQAILAAVPGDEIRVADGLYHPDRGSGSPFYAYEFRSGVSVLGGYAGCGAADPNARDLVLYETVLSGDLNGDDGPDYSNYSENSQTIFGGGSPLINAVLEGFTLSHANGAALTLWSGQTTIRQCRFIDILGVGLAFDGPTTARVEDCVVADNLGINNAAGASFSNAAGPTFERCRFYNNTGGPGPYGNTGRGGAVVVWDNSPPVFRSCTFIGNTGEVGGAMAIARNAAPALTNCTMIMNSATEAGGGIHAYDNCDPVITNSIVWNNSDPSGTTREAQIHVALDATVSEPVVKYSLVEGGWPATVGYGILNTDPLFVDADGPDNVPGTADDDISLQSASPCIDAGNDAIVTVGDFDIQGEARIQHCQVDIGADESPYFADCNSNGTPDGCETESDPSIDCDQNGSPDSCDPDCNANGQPDLCDIGSGTSADCNGDGIPDDCEPDCNGNGTADGCDLAAGTSPDCNINEVPDECDIASGTSEDCNGNAVPDECDLIAGTAVDCNGNGVPDSCDLAGGASFDCNSNSIPDECETDCNGNGLYDDCDIASGFSLDCTGNGIPDECDIASGLEPDCNANTIPDDCDVASGSSVDCNLDDVPDECQSGVVCHTLRADASMLGVPEGATASLWVWLATAPASPLDVATSITAGDADLTISSGALLTFDAGNYDQPQEVVLSAAQDDDFSNGTATLQITAPGVEPLDATAIELDDDAAPSVIYVDLNAAGLQTGLSWTDAFVDLQDALDAAATAAGNTPDIWVAQGVYLPDRGTGDIHASFRIPDGAAVLGGFAAGDALGDRDPALKETVLSGDLLANDDPAGPPGPFTSNCCGTKAAPGCDDASCEALVCQADPACCDTTWNVYCRQHARVLCCECAENTTLCDNSVHVVTVEQTGAGTILDGFTISSGYAPGPDASDRRGAGVNVSCATVTVQGCTLENNRAFRFGAGLSADVSDDVTIIDTLFDGNRVLGDNEDGGGGLAATASHVTITDSAFTNNDASIWSLGGSSGGAIFSVDSDLHAVGTDFINNLAFYHGGAARGGSYTDCLFQSNWVDNGLANGSGGALSGVNRVESCRFEDNQSQMHGGAISGVQSIVGSYFANNRAFWFGGAVRGGTLSVPVSIDRCEFQNNVTSKSGGALYLSGYYVVSNSMFHGNVAGTDGGTIGVDQGGNGPGEIRNCTIQGGHASGSTGGLFADCGTSGGTLRVSNSIFWDNTDGGGSGESAQFFTDCTALTFDHNDVDGLTGAYGGTGNFSAAPLFVSSATGDLHLSPTSPCIDAGNSLLVGCPARDFDGDPRLLDDPLTADTGAGTGAIVDIGADEFASPDCNNNGTLDIDEIAADPGADSNHNGTLDACEPGGADCNADGVPDACDPDCDANGVSDLCEPPPGPSVTVSPQHPAVCPGDSTIVQVHVTGTESWSYQWYKDGIEWPSWSADLALNDAGPEDAGEYHVVIEDDCGWTLSDPVVVSVLGAEPAAAPTNVSTPQSRYLSIAPSNGGVLAVIRVTVRSSPEFPDAVGRSLWVGPPQDYPEEDSSQPGLTFRGAMLQCYPYAQDWGTEDVVHVFGGEIVPGAAYEVQMEIEPCALSPDAPPILSETLLVYTGRWGDITAPFEEDQVSPQPDFKDIGSTVSKFLAEPGAPVKAAAQLQPNTPKPYESINFKDIAADVEAFLNQPFGSRPDITGPCTCPSSVPCDAVVCTSDLACGGGLCFEGFCRDACGRCEPSPVP